MRKLSALVLGVAACGSSPAVMPDAAEVPCAEPPPSLPAGGIGVPTFESIGVYWKPGTDPGDAGCQVQLRKASECAFRPALPLWYDARDGECRGALVQLESDRDYVIQLGLGAFTHELTVHTWPDTFSIGDTINVGARTDTLVIDQGGSAGGYRLYTAGTIDGGVNNIVITAPYVIVRGLVLRGAQQNGIRLDDGAHDVVIEDNDISGWGRLDTDAGSAGASSAVWGVNGDAGVYSQSATIEAIVIQRNRIHDPRTDSNSWGENRPKYGSAHPSGPQGVYLVRGAGHYVIRYNDVYSDLDHMFNDAIGGDENFSDNGFPNRDSDIYGNRISHSWDDAIESEGGNQNVRIWGNYIDRTATGVASSSTYFGPLYIFRNVYNRSRKDQTVALDSDDRLYFGKSGSVSPWGGGRRYLFHNTLLQATDPNATLPLGAGVGISGNGTTRPIENTVSRNNIWQIWKSWWASIETDGGDDNDLDYDLYNGMVNAYTGAESHGIQAEPVYAEGHGWRAEASGKYQLATSSRGFDEGVAIPGFNDGFAGAAPDIGAHEAGTADMMIGACAGKTRPAFCP
jgi:hypothetical protein